MSGLRRVLCQYAKAFTALHSDWSRTCNVEPWLFKGLNVKLIFLWGRQQSVQVENAFHVFQCGKYGGYFCDNRKSKKMFFVSDTLAALYPINSGAFGAVSKGVRAPFSSRLLPVQQRTCSVWQPFLTYSLLESYAYIVHVYYCLLNNLSLRGDEL